MVRTAHAPQGRDGEPGEALQAEEVGRGEERVVAEQIQETPHQVGEEDRELSRTGPTGLLPNPLQEDNIGIGSQTKGVSPRLFERWRTTGSMGSFVRV